MTQSPKTFLMLFALACAVTACDDSTSAPTPSPTATPTGPVHIVVSSYPAAWLAEQVGGPEVRVQNVLPAGEDPPFWAPSGEVVAQVQQAELIVANGAGFERWMETATLPADRIVDSANGLDHIHIQGETHSHGTKGEHSHAGLDPHTWSDPLIYLKQAEAVHAALLQVRPDKKPVFDNHLAAVRTQLTALDRKLKDALTPGKGVKIAANHPAYNYLARRYDLDIHSFDLDPEAVPDAPSIEAVQAWAETVPKPRHLLWEAQPTDEVRRSLPAGTIHVFIDPLEQPFEGQGYDYVNQADRNVATFKALFKKPSPPSSPEKTP